MECEVTYGPPGCGKTTHTIDKIEILGDNDFLFCSFTRAGAAEGLKRLNLPKQEAKKRARTLHSLAYEFTGTTKAQVVDASKLREFSDIVSVPISCNPLEEEHQLGDELLALIGIAACKVVDVREVYNQMHPDVSFGVVDMFGKAYRSWKKKFGYVDFNDMLELMIENKNQYEVKSLFVDEAQDLSPLQWRIINEKIKCEYIHIAGDDDQSIYAWGGADPHGMSKFAKKHNATIDVLSQSYRLPEEVKKVAESIISRVNNRHLKEFTHTGKPGRVTRYADINRVDLTDETTLVLYRNHSVRDNLEEYLIKEAIPYKSISGRKGFFDNFYAEKVRKFLKARANRNDRDFLDFLISNKSNLRDPLQHQIEKNLNWFRREHWSRILRIPDYQMSYLVDIEDRLFDAPKVTLSTIHSAKGMEAEHVILYTEMGNKTWEHLSINPDNEHRVWYVGATRAKKELHLVSGGLDYEIK